MINRVTEAISVSLDAEFGEGYTIMREVNEQDLQEPCFFIACMNPSVRQFLGRRYLRKNRFVIQYFPKSKCMNEECSGIAERLFSCLEYITISETLLRGTCMHYEIVDGVLNFFVNYDFFLCERREETPAESAEFTNRVEG